MKASRRLLWSIFLGAPFYRYILYSHFSLVWFVESLCSKHICYCRKIAKLVWKQLFTQLPNKSPISSFFVPPFAWNVVGSNHTTTLSHHILKNSPKHITNFSETNIGLSDHKPIYYTEKTTKLKVKKQWNEKKPNKKLLQWEFHSKFIQVLPA